MVRSLEEVYGLVYEELTQTVAALEPLRREAERIKNPLKDREGFEEIPEVRLEINYCSQEYGFISGFEYGVAFMVECMGWPGQEQHPGYGQKGCDHITVDKNGKPLPPGIWQRASGKYEDRVGVDYQSYSVYGDTITEVKKKMTELRYKLEHGEFITSLKITVEEWFKVWMEQYKENQVKAETIISYTDYFNIYIKESLGKKKLVDIRGGHIRKLYNGPVKKGMALSNIRIVSAILNGCFRQAMKNGLVERNSVPMVILPKGSPEKQRRIFTKEEQDIFIEYTKGSYLYSLFALVIRTELRGGGVRGLELSDMDKVASLLHIQRTLKYTSGQGFLEDVPKTVTSRRDIPLTKDMVMIIDKQKTVYGGRMLRMDGYIFRLPDGTPISRKQLQNEVGKVVKRIGADGIAFERFAPHCFHYTPVTRAMENGMKPQTLKTILGYSTLSMAMGLCSHVLSTTGTEGMGLIANAF